MSQIQTRGIVINEQAFKEHDKRLTLLLKDMGKVTVYAKGAKKSSSKLLAGTQLFCWSDFNLYDGGRFLSLNSVDLIESFYNLHRDYDTLIYASYLLELCNKIILPGSPCDDIIKLLLKSLKTLASTQIPRVNIARVFEFLFLKLNGFTPELDACSQCGSEENLIFFGKEGLLCGKCGTHTKSVRISGSALCAINHIFTATDKLFAFRLSKTCEMELEACAKLFLHSNIEVEINSFFT